MLLSRSRCPAPLSTERSAGSADPTGSGTARGAVVAAGEGGVTAVHYRGAVVAAREGGGAARVGEVGGAPWRCGEAGGGGGSGATMRGKVVVRRWREGKQGRWWCGTGAGEAREVMVRRPEIGRASCRERVS